jgi:putative transposase
MKTNTLAPNDKGFRFPPAMISHAVWLSFRFSLSFRDVEELLAQRGVIVSYETIRQWCLKFGQTYANELRQRRPRCGDKWHMDEVFLTIRGERHSLWRAVDQDGNVLDILVQSRRNKKAAKRCFRKLLKGLQYIPRVEQKMRKFTSATQAQRFLSAFGPIAGHFQPHRHRLRAKEYRILLQGRFLEWNEITTGKRSASQPTLLSISLSSVALLFITQQ